MAVVLLASCGPGARAQATGEALAAAATAGVLGVSPSWFQQVGCHGPPQPVHCALLRGATSQLPSSQRHWQNSGDERQIWTCPGRDLTCCCFDPAADLLLAMNCAVA